MKSQMQTRFLSEVGIFYSGGILEHRQQKGFLYNV